MMLAALMEIGQPITSHRVASFGFDTIADAR